MSLTHRYTDFGSLSASQSGTFPDTDTLEDAKLEAFENGYQAGWDDALKAHASEQSKMTSDIALSFQELSFTYREAQVKLMASMAPLLEQMVEKLLPEMARKSLGAHVVQQLTELSGKQAESAIEIAVAPANLQSIEDLLSAQAKLPFEVVCEPSLSSGQVYIRAGKSEREINLDAVIDGISEALTAFLYETKKEPTDG